MKNILWLIILIIVINSEAFSQNYSVIGKIISADKKEALINANVTLRRLGLDELFGGYSGNDGQFVIKKLVSAGYLLKISLVGYKQYTKRILIKNENLDLGTIILEPDSIFLKEVTAEGKAILMQQVDDTIKYDAKAVKLHEDAVVEDLVKKLPGIQIDNKGNIKAQGEKVAKIYVDKKPYFGNDTKAALQNLPANIIDQVKVYDEVSEQSKFTGFSDGETFKVINLETKLGNALKSANFGKYYGSYGSDERYQLGGNHNRFDSLDRISVVGMTNNMNVSNFSGVDYIAIISRNVSRNVNGVINGLGASYAQNRETDNNISGSYFYTANDVSNETGLNRYYLPSTGINQSYYETRISGKDNSNHKIDLKYSHNFDSYNTITFIPAVRYQKNENSSSYNALTRLDESIISEVNNTSKSKGDIYNLSGSLMYNTVLSKSGNKLSIQFDGVWNGNNSNEDWTNITKKSSGNSESVSKNSLQNDEVSKRLAANILYITPINETNLIQLSYNISYSLDESDKKNYEILSGSSILDSTASSVFDNKYLSQKIGLGYNYKTKGINIVAGLFYNTSANEEIQDFPAAVDYEKTFNAVLPLFSVSYEVKNRKKINLKYSSQLIVPSLDKLQGVLNNKNPLQLSIGDPNLKESVRHSVNLSLPQGLIDFMEGLTISCQGSLTSDFIGNSTLFASSDTMVLNNIVLQKGAVLTRPQNFNNQILGKVDFAYYFRSNGQELGNNNVYALSMNYNYIETPNSYNGIVQKSVGHYLGFGFKFNFNQIEDLNCNFDFNYFYNFAQNKTRTIQNTTYSDYDTKLNVRYRFPFNFSVDFMSQYLYSTRALGNSSRDNVLANLSLSQKFLKGNAAELMFSIYDLFNQNKDITRTMTDLYIEERKANLAKRCYLMTFTYNIRYIN